MIPTQEIMKTALCVEGVQTLTNNTLEKTDQGKIPLLWQSFYQKGLDQRAKKEALHVYGVYFNYRNDHTGDFMVLTGVGSGEAFSKDASLSLVTIEPGNYLKFSCEGELPKAVIDGWYAVWDYFSNHSAPKRRYQTDYELYTPAGVDIFIGVEL
tara:strand:- start:128 stop:589 length:462 start_codon:yes stop_codon:yes gene_type:complete